MPDKISIKDIMITKVVTVFPDTPLTDAFRLMLEGGFNGLPVVDKDNKVAGIVTDYDLIIKTSSVHLPSFIKLFGEPPFEAKNHAAGGADSSIITVKSVMNQEPLILSEEADLKEVVKTFGEHHRVNPIPVVDKDGKLKGVVSRFDVVKFYADILNGKVNLGQI